MNAIVLRLICTRCIALTTFRFLPFATLHGAHAARIAPARDESLRAVSHIRVSTARKSRQDFAMQAKRAAFICDDGRALSPQVIAGVPLACARRIPAMHPFVACKTISLSRTRHNRERKRCRFHTAFTLRAQHRARRCAIVPRASLRACADALREPRCRAPRDSRMASIVVQCAKHFIAAAHVAIARVEACCRTIADA